MMKELNKEDRLLTIEAFRLLLDILEDLDPLSEDDIKFKKELTDLLERL